jgi:hypothetical protein
VKGRASLRLFSGALVFALGALVARLVAGEHGPRVAPDFAQPLVVVTAWGAYGGTCFALLAATIGCAAIALFAILRDPESIAPAAHVALAAAAAIAAAYAWPFVFSSDPYAYAAYGWLAAHGVDPYRIVPRDVHGAFVDAARFQWGGSFPACLYGPAFVALAEGVVRFVEPWGPGAATPDDVASALWLLRLLAAAAFLGSIFALDAGLNGLAARPRFTTLALLGLNPVALWSVAEGHNDAFVLLAACGGFALVRRGRAGAGALLLGSTALLKATGFAFALGFALDAYAFAVPRARRILAGIAVGVFASVALAVPPALKLLDVASKAGHSAAPSPPGTSPRELVGLLPTLLLSLAATTYGFLRLRERERDGHAWLGIAVWLVLPNIYPWYCLWFLPAVAAAGAGAVAAALYGVTITDLVRYLPDAVGRLEPNETRLAAAIAAAPLLVALATLRRTPTQRKTTPP